MTAETMEQRIVKALQEHIKLVAEEETNKCVEQIKKRVIADTAQLAVNMLKQMDWSSPHNDTIILKIVAK